MPASKTCAPDCLSEPMICSRLDSVVATGAKIRKPLRLEPWGMREFAVETIDGHRIMFAGRDSP